MLLKSQNGWPASSDRGVVNIQTFSVPVSKGTVKLPVRAEAAPALIEMLKWWDANVEPVAVSGYDPDYGTWGYSYRLIRGSASTLSNHASGTAIDINAPKHPLGSRGTVPADKATAIRAKAASLGLRWGGDYSSRPDEMHFEINTAPPAAVTQYSEAKAAGQSAVATASEAASFAKEAAGETYRRGKGAAASAAKRLRRNWWIAAGVLAVAGLGAFFVLRKRKKMKALGGPRDTRALPMAANPRRRKRRG